MGHDHGHPHDHDHPHEHTHDHGTAEGTWRDDRADDPLSVSRRRSSPGRPSSPVPRRAPGCSGRVGRCGARSTGARVDRRTGGPGGRPQPVNPWTGNARFLAGDHHIHTQFLPDAQYPIETQVARAQQYGLSWM